MSWNNLYRHGLNRAALCGRSRSRRNEHAARDLTAKVVNGSSVRQSPAKSLFSLIQRSEIERVSSRPRTRCPLANLVQGADPKRTIDLVMTFWVLKGPGGRTVLVDAGFYSAGGFDSADEVVTGSCPVGRGLPPARSRAMETENPTDARPGPARPDTPSCPRPHADRAARESLAVRQSPRRPRPEGRRRRPAGDPPVSR
jgi:hypothetical protein